MTNAIGTVRTPYWNGLDWGRNDMECKMATEQFSIVAGHEYSRRTDVVRNIAHIGDQDSSCDWHLRLASHSRNHHHFSRFDVMRILRWQHMQSRPNAPIEKFFRCWLNCEYACCRTLSTPELIRTQMELIRVVLPESSKTSPTHRINAYEFQIWKRGLFQD